MSGLTHTVWYVCTIAFFFLIGYAVAKRPLWFPGLVVMAYPNVGMARLGIPMLGSVRGYYLIAGAGIILTFLILMKRKNRKSPYPGLGFTDQAPLFLLGMLLLGFLRMFFDYLSSGRLFYLNEIPAALVGTVLPLFILLAYPPRDDVFPEFMLGVAIGSLLSVLPAFMDFETIRSLFENIMSGGTIEYEKLQFRDRNTIAYFVFQGAVSLFYLYVVQHTRRFRRLVHIIIGMLIIFMLLNQSRRWFLGLLSLSGLYYFYRFRSRAYTLRTPAEIMLFKIIPGVVILLIGGYLTYAIQSRFERFEVNKLTAELIPSTYVEASISRADLSKEAFEVFKEYPVLGSGMLIFGWEEMSFEAQSDQPISGYIGAHNLIMDILVQYGIVGGLCASIFFIAMFCSLRKWKKKGRTLQFKKELSLTSMYLISLLVVAFTGGENPHNLGLIALLPCVMRALITVEAQRLRSDQHQLARER